jgi:hypothetical protein
MPESLINTDTHVVRQAFCNSKKSIIFTSLRGLQTKESNPTVLAPEMQSDPINPVNKKINL